MPDRRSLRFILAVVLVIVVVAFLAVRPRLGRRQSIGGATSSLGSFEVWDTFPFSAGASWTYSADWAAERYVGDEPEIQRSQGSYTQTVISIETDLAGKTAMVEFELAGENYVTECGGFFEPMSGTSRFWYVADKTRLFPACSKNQAVGISRALIYGRNPGDVLPEYVLPLEVGMHWAAFEDMPAREDGAYQWGVEALEGVSVTAGDFGECYAVVLFTLPDSTVKWVCPGVGLAAVEYHHHGSANDYRAELQEYSLSP